MSYQLKGSRSYWKLKHLVRKFVWSSEAVYMPICKLRGRENYSPDNFDIFVSGFPRSGNNFIAFALRLFSENNLEINKPCHIPPLIHRSIRLEKPTFLTIREPVASAVSWSIFCKCPLRHSLDYYCQFHRMIRSTKPSLLVLNFDDFTNDLPATLEKIQNHSNIPCDSSVDHESATKKVFEEIEKYELARIGGQMREHQTPRPTQDRVNQKSELMKQMKARKMKGILQQANEIYEEFLA